MGKGVGGTQIREVEGSKAMKRNENKKRRKISNFCMYIQGGKEVVVVIVAVNNHNPSKYLSS